MEIIFEIAGELLTELFISLSQFFFPDKKLSEKTRKALKICSAIFSAVIALAAVIGVYLLIEEGVSCAAGWILIAAGVIFLGVGIAMFIKKRKQ